MFVDKSKVYVQFDIKTMIERPGIGSIKFRTPNKTMGGKNDKRRYHILKNTTEELD